MEQMEIEKEIIEEKKSISHIKLFLLMLFIAVITGFSVFYYISDKRNGRQMVDASVFDIRLQNIENSVALHEKRVAKIEEDLSKNPPQTKSEPQQVIIPDELKKQVESLEKELKSLKTNNSTQNNAQISNAITLISSFNRLSNKILLGKPFSSELSNFLDNYGEYQDKQFDEALNALTSYSISGIPSESNLLASFDEAVAASNKNDSIPPENLGFWQTLFFNISHLVTIHKIDKNQSGNSSDAIIGRAESDLESGEIEAAIAEIKSLPDNLRNNFSAWLEEAQIASISPSLLDQIEEKTMKKAFVNNAPEK
ncbi:MAG: hypothetical protein WCJ33_06365 [Pseudomonadota bacterium]